LNDAKLQFVHLEGADLRGALLQGAKLNYAHLGKYIDRFQAEDKVDAEMEGCKPKSDGLINIISQPKEPSAAEICRWALCHPAQDDHIELPEYFSCHGYKSLGYISYQTLFPGLSGKCGKFVVLPHQA
jgi:hypothetical protein